jgi:signal transduction histidine kinase
MVEARLADLMGKPIVRAIAKQAVDRFDFNEAAFTRTVVDMCSSARGFETVVENYEGRQFEISGAGVTDAIGEVSGLYIIIRDVTERSRMDEMQRETRRAQTIASLAAGITHEVNNPLAYARANVNHVIDELAAHPEKRNDTAFELQDVLAEALEGIDRIGTIVERVRKFAHTPGSVREPIPIGPLFEEAMRIRSSTSGPGIQILLDVSPGLSPALGFRDGLLETLLNLLDNALHALRETGGVIRLKARPHEHSIRIEVEDDGPGVPEEIRDRIFEPFFTTASSEIGTGLGLTVSAKLVADFGGTLRHEPVEDGGARFVIELPEGPR